MYCTLGTSTTSSKNFKQIQPSQEHVYNLLPKPDVRPEKIPRYKSVYSSTVKAFYESQKNPHKTMGSYKTQLPSPKNFLKKHTRDMTAHKKRLESHSNEVVNLCDHLEKGSKKPPVPRHNERPPMPSNGKKNFIRENIRNVSRSPAKKPALKVADTRKGDGSVIEYSGLVPKYNMKKDFGKVPDYLTVRKECMDQATKEIEDSIRRRCDREAPKLLSEDSKQQILAGLLKKWADCNRQYLRLPLCIDTLGARTRKLTLEQELKELEKNIALMQQHSDFVVAP